MLFKFVSLRNRLKQTCSKRHSCEDLLLSNCVQVKLICVKSVLAGFCWRGGTETCGFSVCSSQRCTQIVPVSVARVAGTSCAAGETRSGQHFLD